MMLWPTRCRQVAVPALFLLPLLLGAGGVYAFLALPADRDHASAVAQWGVLAAVHDVPALQSLQQSASGGSVAAARTLGQLLVQRPDAASVREGQRWLTQAARQDDGPAQLQLGKLLFKGAPGLPADPLAARPWLEAAVQHGQPGAAHYLGLLFRQDLAGQPRQPAEALRWLERAARAGIADSQFLLGQMLLTGDGAETDPVRAREWLEAAAEQDHPEANLQLLMAYTRHEMGLKPTPEAEKRQWMEAQHSLRHRPPSP
jgi:TPR repeat protein